MSKHIQLSIADPCHENWDNMTPAEKGRYCQSCSRQVIDFTDMSDLQLAAFFKKPVQNFLNDALVCGRFYNDQLNRDIEIPGKRIPWVRYFFQFALPAFLASAKASAQGNGGIKKPHSIVSSRLTGFVAVAPPVEASEPHARINIKGKVVDENNDPVPYASVLIKGTMKGAPADSSGMFRVSNIVVNDSVTIQVTCVGFKPAEIMLAGTMDPAKDIIIQLERRILEEMNIPSVCSTVTMGAYRVGGVFMTARKRQEKEGFVVIQPPKEKPAMIKVFPNPVLTGTSINIGCENLEEGYYTFQLLSQSGQQLQRKQLWIDSEAGIINIEIRPVPAGHYLLTLTHKESSKRFAEKIIVQ